MALPKRIILVDRRPIRAMRLADALRRQEDMAVLETVVSLPLALKSSAAAEADAVVVVGAADIAGLDRARPELLARRLVLAVLPEEEVDALRLGDDYGPVAARVVEQLRNPQPLSGTVPGARSLPLVCIGASTGGLSVLEQILSVFPEDCPPTLIVQHIRGSFSAGLAERLNRIVRPEVAEGFTGAPIEPGRVYLAPGDQHHLELRAQPSPHCRLIAGEKVTSHRPSVDALFNSAALHAPAPGVGVLLTGMGRDGAAGLLKLRQAGWHTIAQDEATSTVYGMPRVAVELGAVDEILPDRAIGTAILRACARIAQKQAGITS